VSEPSTNTVPVANAVASDTLGANGTSPANAAGAPSSNGGAVAAAPAAAARASGSVTSAHADVPAATRARYLRTLTARIRQYRQYPYLARRQGLEGMVCLRIWLGARGQLTALRVTCGGERESLVEAAKTAVTEAAPFEPLPPDLGTSLTVDVPIVFRLEEG
jgi:TonB family protein